MRRVRRLRRPPALDVALAAALTLLLQLELWLGERYEDAPALPGDKPTTAVLLLATTLPLAARRIHPLGAFAASIGGLTALSLVQGGGEAGGLFLLLLFAVYSAAAHSDRPVEVAALAAVAVTVHNARDPYLSGVGDQVFAPAFGAAGFVLGRIVHARGRRADRAEASAAEAIAQERARLARELHDVVAHSVSVMVMQAKGGSAVLESDPARAREAFATIESSGRQAIDELRRMLGLLRADERDAATGGPLQPQPGLVRLPALVDEVRAAGLDVVLRVEGEPVALPPGEDLSAYRIVQEGLTNVLKHAGATRAEVTLRWSAGALEVEVADDGGGGRHVETDGTVVAVLPSSGRGLVGMRERVALFGGELVAGPRPGGGFAVRARLPVREAAA